MEGFSEETSHFKSLRTAFNQQLLSPRHPFPIVQEHKEKGGKYQCSADESVESRVLVQDKHAEEKGDDDIKVVENGDPGGGCELVGKGDAVLADHGADAKDEHTQPLPRGHRLIVQYQRRQQSQAGKGGEKQHDNGAVCTLAGKMAYAGIGGTGGHAPQHPDQGGKQFRHGGGIRPGQDDNPGKGYDDTDDLHPADPFF